jgi:hypothetical protein
MCALLGQSTSWATRFVSPALLCVVLAKQYFGNNGTNAENRTWIVMPEELFIVFVSVRGLLEFLNSHVVSTPTIIPLSPLLTESVHPGDCDNVKKKQDGCGNGRRSSERVGPLRLSITILT